MPARLTKQDDALIRHAVENYLFTVSEAAAITKRPEDKISRRFRVLGPNGRVRDGKHLAGLGFLKSTPQPFNKWGEDIWYPLQPSFDYAHEQGWIQQRIRATDREDSTKLPHDLRVREFKLVHRARYGDAFRWTQHYYNTHDRWGKEDQEHIFADGFFYLDRAAPSPDYPSFFVEVERTTQHSYDARGLDSRVQKCDGYLDYFERGLFQEKFQYPDFRVLFILSSERKARNFAELLRKTSDRLTSEKFWITDYERSISAEEAIYITPVDYEHRRYSLADAYLL